MRDTKVSLPVAIAAVVVVVIVVLFFVWRGVSGPGAGGGAGASTGPTSAADFQRHYPSSPGGPPAPAGR